GPPRPCVRPWWPCGRGNRGGACAPACSVGRSASRGFSAELGFAAGPDERCAKLCIRRSAALQVGRLIGEARRESQRAVFCSPWPGACDGGGSFGRGVIGLPIRPARARGRPDRPFFTASSPVLHGPDRPFLTDQLARSSRAGSALPSRASSPVLHGPDRPPSRRGSPVLHGPARQIARGVKSW